jgi:DNA mismatch repair protein MutL
MRVKPTEAPGVRVSGYLMPISAARRNRRMQYVFLNGRPIEDQIINRAVRDGYGGFPPGLHPALFLYLEVEPALVDVNVHPAKREVRFRRPSEVTLAIMDAVAATLAAHARGESEEEGAAQEEKPVPPPVVPEIKVSPVVPAVHKPVEAPSRPAPKPISSPAPRPTLVLQPLVTPRQQELDLPPAPAPSAPEPAPAPLPNFRHIGTLHGQYAIFENKEGMVLMSPRAARERIIFERLQESNKRPLVSQRLLVPELLELDTRDMGVAMEVKPQLEQAGFQLSPFGRNTLRVEAVPALLPLRKVSDFVQELLRVFTSGEVRLNRARSPFEPFARQLARQYAQQEDVASYLQNPLPLLAALLECEIPYCSPGGKSTLLPFPMAELNRRFQN